MLAVVYDLGSAGPADIVASARGVADVVFICDPSRPRVARDLPALRAAGSVIETPEASAERIADIVAAVGASGITTFSEYQMTLTADVAERCGFAFHDKAVAALLTDKYRQRQALAAAGVDSVPCRPVVSAGDLAEALATIGVPAILKPRRGAGSRDTYRITDVASRAEAAAALVEAGADGFLLEEVLEGDPGAAGPDWGDYVSVESLTADGEIRHVCVTGKFPLVAPFRETGQFVPSTLSPALAEAVTALAGAALRALGVRHGVTHTEIKLTAGGPRIIEVNGRIGGYVGDVLMRASGYDLLRAAIEVALRRPARMPPVRFGRVAFRRYLPAPGRRVRLTALHGVSRVRRIAGVEHVEVRAEPGHVLDPRSGTQNCIGVVYGTSENHGELKDIIAAISDAVDPVYAAAP